MEQGVLYPAVDPRNEWTPTLRASGRGEPGGEKGPGDGTMSVEER